MKSEDKPEQSVRRVIAIVRDVYVFEEEKGEVSDRSKPGIWWWEPDTEKSSELRQYAFDSSIHGLKYTSQPSRHLSESNRSILYVQRNPVNVSSTFTTPFHSSKLMDMIFWVVVILVALVLLVWLLILLWNDYSSPKLVMMMDTEITDPRNIPFPRVRVCRAKGVIKTTSKRVLNNTNGGDRSQKLALLEAVACNTDIRTRTNNNRKGEQLCSELIQECAFDSQSVECGWAFQSEVSEGETETCCTLTTQPTDLTQNAETISDEFNNKKTGKYPEMHPNKFTSYHSQQYTMNPSEVSFQVHMTPQLKRCSNSSSKDFAVFISRIIPDTSGTPDEDRLALQPNSQLQVQLIPSITKIDERIRTYDATSRKCYLPDEHKLTDFQTYTKSNCLKECLRANLEESCRCRTNHGQERNSTHLCTNVQASCINRMTEKLQNLKNGMCQHCLPLCNEVHYNLLTTSSSMATNNRSHVRIFFNSNPVYANILSATPQHSIVYYIALTGGLLSLCLGCSGISIIEIIYYCTLRLFCVRRRRKTKWAIATEKLHKAISKIKSKNDRFRKLGKQAVISVPDVKVQNYIQQDFPDSHIVNVES